MGLTAEAYQRQQLALLPPGRLWRLVGSVLSNLFLGTGDELALVDQRVDDFLTELDPSQAVELLPEYESELDLPSDGGNAQRQARIVAHTVARQRFRPVDFQNALAPILGQAPGDVVVIERSPADALAMGDAREIFVFFIYRDPTAPGSYNVDDAQALVDKIKPSNTIGHVIESVEFLCDDEFSLCDRDILGA